MTQQLSHFGIGASEIAAVVGLNPYASPWDVWRHKTGETADKPMTAPMEWGHRLEPAIRQAYVDQTNAAVYVPPSSLFSTETPFARATPDGIALGDHASPADVQRPMLWSHLLQCKNVGTFVERAWRNGPPEYVQLQEQWELYVTGLARADVAVLIGGSDFRVYTVHRDDKMIADLVTIASEFWSRVETKRVPDIDDSEACKRHFEARLKKSGAVELQADTELDEAIALWEYMHREKARIEKKVDTIKNQVRAALAEAGADRVIASQGVPYLQRKAGAVTTNWRLVAELLGSTKCTADEFSALVAANTEQKPDQINLMPSKTWTKETA